MTERMLGPVGSTLRRRFYGVPLALLAAIVLVLGVSAAGGASLPGSTFEIDTDANLTVQGAAPALDWANVTDIKKSDLATGSGDDSFGGGSKEDTAVPVVTDGSIPPNKSDLKTFGVYQEETASGKFLHLFWTRVQDPSGHDEHGLRVQQVDDEVVERCHPDQDRGRPPDHLRPDQGRHLARAEPSGVDRLRVGTRDKPHHFGRRHRVDQHVADHGRELGGTRRSSTRGRSARHRSISMRSSTPASATRSVPRT